jgi:hypothetical protein
MMNLWKINIKKYANVNPKNFGTIADLRERRINQILI